MVTFTFDPDMPVRDRRALAVFLEETSSRALAGGRDRDDLSAAFVRALAVRLDATGGPVSIRIGQLDEERRAVVRRVLYTAAERARSGEASRPVSDAVAAILAAWERAIKYDPRIGWDGPRNLWNEPVTVTGTRGVGGVGLPVVR